MRPDVHPFCYEFSSALLANLLRSSPAHLERNPKLAKDVLTVVLNLLKEKLSASVLWHLLLGLSHMAQHKEKLAGPFEETYFSDKIADFLDQY
jgi:hypothetical protein